MIEIKKSDAAVLAELERVSVHREPTIEEDRAAESAATLTELSQLKRVETDIDKARKYRLRMQTMLLDVCNVIAEAKREGIIIGFQLSADAFGNQFVSSLTTVKELKD